VRQPHAAAGRGPDGIDGDRTPLPVALEVLGTDAVRADVLETFPYEYSGSPAVVEVDTDEFTAVCPWSGLPDFGRLVVRYLPKERVLELRSLKYYLLSYRQVGIFQEHAANRIMNDLAGVIAPVWMDLRLEYRIRGGIHTTVTARWPNASASADAPAHTAQETQECSTGLPCNTAPPPRA
jgi:7-cyano-7-deazaguanine reductase